MQRLTSQQRALLCWVALPMGLMFLIMLACVAPVEEECLGSNCAGLTPQQQQELAETQDLLLGTWDLTYEGYNRDDVDRLLFAGRSTWSLEIFDVTRATDGLYNWRGAIKPTELCLVSQADFDAQSTTCETLGPVQAGSCSGHTCTVRVEYAISGQYDTAEKVLDARGFSSARLFFANPEVGYANLSVSLSLEMLVRGDKDNTSDSCDSSWCDWNVTTGGLFEGQYPRVNADDRSASLTRVNTQHRPAEADVNEEDSQLVISAQTKAEELLLGDWTIRTQLEGLDSVERPVSFGDARYTLEIFEVNPVQELMGTWEFKAALRAESLCYVSKASAEEGSYTCDTFNPTTLGSCTGATCTPQDEMGVQGRFRDLDNQFSLDYNFTDTRSYYLDDQGYVYLSIPVAIREATLTAQTIAPTRCTRDCDWSVNTDGAYDDSHGTRRGDDRIFEMGR